MKIKLQNEFQREKKNFFRKGADVFNSQMPSNKGRGGWKTIGQSLDLIPLFFLGVSNSHQFNRRALPSSSLARPTLYIYIKERLWNEARERQEVSESRPVRLAHSAIAGAWWGYQKGEFSVLGCLTRSHLIPAPLYISYLIGVARREDTGRSALHGWRPDWQLNKSRDRRKKNLPPSWNKLWCLHHVSFTTLDQKGWRTKKNKIVFTSYLIPKYI